ncbi:uncharacterized protein JCM15063_003266 [Sporobolomyces koalae]|uniref:uncharacterized protein n=1 Tax=Sporobolomyces koalae TaxID=500713 RepID=UPI00317FCDF4
MLPDNFLTRGLVKVVIGAADAVPAIALVHTVAAYLTYPAPPSVALTLSLAPEVAADFLFQLRLAFSALTLWLGLELVWWPLAKLSAFAIDRRWWDIKQDEKITSEERWRLWTKMLESTENPEEWLKSFFLTPGRSKAPRGAADPSIEAVDLDKIGRTNIEELIAFVMFNSELKKLKPKSIERAEIHSMILLLEATFTLSRSSNSPPFKFLRGKSPHKAFLLSKQPLELGHKPLVFYACTYLASQMGCVMLYLAGFRYFGPRTAWPLPLFCHSSTKLESVHDHHEHEKMRASTQLSARTAYWFKPASGEAQEKDQRPIVFCHGISGTYGPSCFVAALACLSGRAVFIPIHPYLFMRLSPPSAILSRLEYVASIRRMLWRHGFGLTSLDADEDDPEDVTHDSDAGERAGYAGSAKAGQPRDVEEDWRRAKAIIVAHSAGAGMAGWLMRDAPDIVAGLVLIDPMCFLLYCPDSARNFYRTHAKTAGEHFFKYFAFERGINHFLSRHVLWSTSTLFAPNPASRIPSEIKNQIVPPCARWNQEAGYDVPRYAAEVNGLQQGGAFPTVVFLSERDCILPIEKLLRYFSRTEFGKIVQGETPARLRPWVSRSSHSTTSTPSEEPNAVVEKNKKTTKSDSVEGGEEGSVRLMLGIEHAAILLRYDWCKEVNKAIDQVGARSEQWEQQERIDLLQS